MAKFKDWKYAEMFVNWAQAQVDAGKMEAFDRVAVMDSELSQDVCNLAADNPYQLCIWHKSGEAGGLASACATIRDMYMPVTDYAMPQVEHCPPQNACIKEAPATSHDAHYRAIEKALGVQPIQIGEAIVDRESIPRKAAKHMATAAEYLARAGTKAGEAWEKDAQKASNHIFRALNGRWPWDPEPRSH